MLKVGTVVAHTLNSNIGRQRQVELCESVTNQVYIKNSKIEIFSKSLSPNITNK